MFNQKNELRRMMQGFNALNMLYVTYHYYTTPEALFTENGVAFASSLINFYTLGQNEDILTDLFGQYASAAYTGSIITNAMNGSMQIPAMVGIWQAALLNPANIYFSLFSTKDNNARDGSVPVVNDCSL